jgi:hypothetical protein
LTQHQSQQRWRIICWRVSSEIALAKVRAFIVYRVTY